MTIINMTPHGITICGLDGRPVRTIPASGQIVRLAVRTEAREPIDGCPTSLSVFGEPEGLPELVNGVYYTVSQLIKSALPNRADLLVPAELVRDQAGAIVGCRSLGLAARPPGPHGGQTPAG